ncbi:CoA transferase [Gordonia jinghuaiqii]|uniref:CoA transferase n=1 Tax=Gordonia jinghuaiqii TaxID=2758710 RepID=A0A7D7RNZ4_9ACTN|nr:CoA transferase [Gordonia jinghuaiqii]MCR5979797.1 CoA transferase [Gordonia jinghuaiqii]QMT00813.1 CoA transferase [Gordonia jinghuaiqii]
MNASHQSGTRPFEGLTVVELIDDPAGEYTGKLFADLGADVIKVEPPRGAPSRHQGPFIGGEDNPDRSLEFWSYGTSKRSIVADSADEDDIAVVRALCGRADMLIVDREEAVERFGASFDALRERNPGLILVVISPFGLKGPWAGYRTSDLVALAAGGLLNSCGYDDHSIPPIRPGGNQGYQLGAIFAYMAAMLALVERQSSGQGQILDVSIHGANAVSGELANPYWFYPKAVVQRQTCRHAQPVPTQPALFECADGAYVYLALILADQHMWRALVSWMDEIGVAADLVEPEYDSLEYRQEQFGHIQQMIEVFFMIQDSATAYDEGQRRGLPVGPLKSFEELPADPQLAARGFFTQVPDGEGGTITYPGAPWQFSAFSSRPGRAPRLGEHTDAVRAEVAAGTGVQSARA